MENKLYLDIETNDSEIINQINKEILKREGSVNTIIISIPSHKHFNKKLLSLIEDDCVAVYFHSDILKEQLEQIIITFIENEKYNIAIDGPSGSGKSTIAKALASILSIDYLDTGAMYRAITYMLIKDKIDLHHEDSVCSYIADLSMLIKNQRIYLDGKDVQDHLRDQIVTKNVSLVSGYECVRSKLVEIQRRISKENSSILDGRDIGTVVLPKAKYKFYLNADVEIRARRRFEETKEDISYEEILKDIIKRDEHDKNREISPLRKAPGAVEIDSTSLSISEVADEILKSMRAADHYE